MRRYFFHVCSGVDLTDEIGVELPDLAAVRKESLTSCGEFLKEAGDIFWDSRDWRMQVVDDTGREVLHFTFAVIEPDGRGAA